MWQQHHLLFWGTSSPPPSLLSWLLILCLRSPAVCTADCITTGWLNETLDGIAFWRCLEVVIEDITGAVPRQDDKYWTTLQARLKAEGKSL